MSPSEFKKARKRLGLSVKEMARAVAANPRTIRRWEAGGRDIPGTAIIAVQNMMEVGPEVTFEEEEPPF